MTTPTIHNPGGTRISLPHKQKGVVLAVALILLVAVTMASMASLKTGLLELQMAGNEESRMSAFQGAQASIEAVIAELDNFQVVGAVGYTNCTADYHNSDYYDASAEVDCDTFDTTTPDDYTGTHTRMHSVRQAPLSACPPAGMETSCANYKVASFSIDGRYDDTANRRGRSEVNQGYLVLIPETEDGS